MKHCNFKNSDAHSRGCFSWSNRKKRNVRFSWSNLPGKIIFKISKKFETRDDILRFQQVCSKWRKHSLTPPTNLLSLNLPLPQTIKDNSKVFPFHDSKSPLVLRVSNIYLITPYQDTVNGQSPWMVMAEELNSGKIKVRHPLTAKRIKNFPQFLDMNRFKAVTLAQGYSFKSSNCVHKVLLCSNSASSVQVLVLYHQGILGKLSLDNDDDDEELSYSWENFKVRQGGNFSFMYLDDVTRFRDKNYGVDRKGRLYVLDTESMSMSNTIILVSEPIYKADQRTCRRTRLVVDDASDELHLVVRENVRVAQKVRFKVYKLNEEAKRWDVVENIGHERVLFVGTDHCFFAMARHFPGCDGNSIVFASHCFTKYNGRDAPDNSLFDDQETEVGMYRFGEGDNFRLLSWTCPEFAGIIWSPPSWFCTRECKEETEDDDDDDDATHQSAEEGNSSSRCLPDDHAEGLLSGSSSGETESNDDNNNDVEMLTDSPDRDEDMESNSDVQEQTSEKHSDNQEQLMNEHFALPLLGFEEETMCRVTRDDQTREHDIAGKKVFDANRTPLTPSFSSAPEKSSTVKFQGVEIRSELLPTLQTIWAKHGNLFTKDTIRSKKMLGCAMEELAELIITLKNTTARTLTDSKVDEMKSTLYDIKRAGLKLKWLEPVIENAIAVQKSKPFIESIAAVDRKKAKIEQEEREFLSRTGKIKRELDENRACLSTRILFPADQIIDLDDNLGDGL